MTQPIILHVKDVIKQFPQTNSPAVNNVTLTLQQGNLLGLLGPSGCGKTTLLRLIAGFERPQAGTIEIAGKMVADEGVATASHAQKSSWIPPEQRQLGMVFQDYALFPHLTVAENISFGLRQLSKPQLRERTAEAITLVGLQGLEHRYPYELSGGQQQRVALARALAPRPALVLLDEPLSNLDQQVRLRLREEVREILKSTGTSGIFVTHDQEEALSISDQVAVMRGGRLEHLGTPEEVYTNPATRFVAEFVTQANFLPAKRRDQRWETEIGCFNVEIQNSRQEKSLSQQEQNSFETGELMLRQEDLILKPNADGVVIIQDRHFLGREYRYSLQTPSGREIYARTSAETTLPIGTRLHLDVKEQEKVRVFSAESSLSQSADSPALHIS